MQRRLHVRRFERQLKLNALPGASKKSPVTLITGRSPQPKLESILLLTHPLFTQPERVQRAALRNMAEVRCLGHRGGANGAELIA